MIHLKSISLSGAIIGLCLISLAVADAVNIDPDTPISSLVASAKAARARGANVEALAYFDAAVSRDSSDYLTLFQRGATYLSLGKNSQASSDFDSVLKIRPGFEGALLQRARIRARNAEWESAREDYKAAGKKGAEELVSLEEAEGAAYLAAEAERGSQWEECVNQAGTAIMTATSALSLRQLRARCRFEQGQVEMGVNDLVHVLQIRPGLVEPHMQISSMYFYSLGDTERGVAQMKKCLHSDPDSKPCKRLYREEKDLLKRIDKVNAFVASKSFNSAVKLLVPNPASPEDEPGLLASIKATVASHRDAGHIHTKAPSELYTALLATTCQCYLGINNHKKAHPYCTELLGIDSSSLHGLLYKAQQHTEAEAFEAAISTLNTAKEHHPDHKDSINQKINEAQLALKKSKQKDYYKSLGVSRDADERTIKKAYRNAVKEYHPDKAMAKGVPKEDAERKMATINEAYEVLSDPELKSRYDSGDDPNDPMSQQQGNPFHGSPFGPGGGGQQFFFPGDGGGGRTTFKFSQGGGGMPFGGFPGFG